jgi:purine-binding chemotaxis protein CheW
MSESQLTDDKVTAQEASTLTKENQVDGVLQNYLDQLLIVATEVSVATETSVVTETAAATEPVVVNDVATLVETTTETITEVDTSEITGTLMEEASLSLQPEVATDEIQDWDPYALDPEVKVEEASSQVSSVSEELQTSVTVADETATVTKDKKKLLWDSSQGVECLLFSVAGLKLAIPLSLLGGVHPAENMKVTPLFGQSDWSLGVWQSDTDKLTIVDSARLIMPERGISLRESGYEYLIQLDRTPWALACEGICDTITLVSESIKWRGDASKRPWLAGTVISEMCALLDVPSLVDLLESHLKSTQG